MITTPIPIYTTVAVFGSVFGIYDRVIILLSHVAIACNYWFLALSTILWLLSKHHKYAIIGSGVI